MRSMYIYVRCVLGNPITRTTVAIALVGLVLFLFGGFRGHTALGVLGGFILALGVAGFWLAGMAVATYRGYVRTIAHYKKRGYIRRVFYRGMSRKDQCYAYGFILAFKDLKLKERHVIEIPAKK